MNTPPVQNDASQEYFTCADIARAIGVSKKTVRRMARRSNWPSQQNGNREEYCPPPKIARLIIATPIPQVSDGGPGASRRTAVQFDDLAPGSEQHTKALRREEAVLLLKSQLHLGKEIALETTVATMRAKYHDIACSTRALRRWVERYDLYGLSGLVEQKRGIVGIKPFADQLDEQDVLRYRAAAIELGSARKGDGKPQLNKARAYRAMIADPTIRGPIRTWLHGEHASKSYVPPSVRRALESSPLTTTLIQRGPKAMKLDGAYTESEYENLKAGTVFTADDMTANVYVWCEWNNEQGFLLIRPQILAAMDVGSMAWLNVRAVMRPKGQYNRDDVWGLIGDVFDDYGKFEAAILEGGIWQSKQITGQLCDDNVRFGGLRDLGCKVIHTRTPRGKIIETAFNSLQHAADNCRGFCGRNERVDCPENVKHALAMVRSGKMSPSQAGFLHINEYKNHLAGVMNALNHERNDGKICRGLCPKDKWDQDTAGVDRVPFPENSKWMYRANFDRVTVTRNGVRISQGTGKYQVSYAYSHPDLVPHRGRQVAVFWNAYDPDTDAVVYTIVAGNPHTLICVAPRAQTIPRLGASEEQLRAEFTRKKLMEQVARTERADLAPYLQRNWAQPAAARPVAAQVDRQIKTAAANQAGVERSRKTVRDFRGTPDALLDEQPTETFSRREVAPLKNERRADDAAALADVSAGAPRESAPSDESPATLNAEELLG